MTEIKLRELLQYRKNALSLHCHKMKWNELLRIAKEKGFILHRHGSKHDIYVHKDRPEDYLQIERHWNSEIRKGLLVKLKKQIGF